MTVGSFRALFHLHNGLTAGSLVHNVRSFVLDFGDGQTTDILSVPADVQDAPSDALQGWYDLSGRRLEGKPTQRGFYINNVSSTKIIAK